MSKIIQAVNVMITNQDRISTVKREKDEYYFLYKEIYLWSIEYNEEENSYSLFFYPGQNDSQIVIQQLEELGFSGVNYVSYGTKSLSTTEAFNSFRDLYTKVREKLFNVNKYLDEIIGEGND